MQLLSKSESWNLLVKIVFGDGNCHHDLQETGQKIASGCGGLPLAISVVGGILFNLNRSKHVWEKIASDVSAAIADSDRQFSNILSLSYNHLPYYLKPCFLYMGAFPEDYEIKASRLVHMWVAEGFVKLSNENAKSLEEAAEDYLKSLVERNLVTVRRNKSDGKTLSCGIHDLLRDLCIRKGEDDKFLHVMTRAASSEAYNIRRLSVPTMDVVNVSSESVRHARSIICSACQSPAFSAIRLLRVLDVTETGFDKFPTEIFQLVNLVLLAFRCRSNVPRGISRLLKLQTLIESSWCRFDVPCEIWELSELIHLNIYGVTWFEYDYPENFVRKKLQTLSLMSLTSQAIRSGLFESIPNIKKLICHFESFPPEGVDLSHLDKLEKLSCGSRFKKSGCLVLDVVRFPSNLRKLTLTRFYIIPKVLTTLSALPNLEVLRICKCDFVGGDEERECEEVRDEYEEEWEASEEDVFRSLKVLHLERLDLVRWKADRTNFPRLRHLRLDRCGKLEGIPSGIGDIPTLQLIEMYGCSESAVASVKEIVQLQESEYDNFDIKLTIYNDNDERPF